MSVVLQIKAAAAKAINELYQLPYEEKDVQVNATRPEFGGDYTIVLFGLVKQLQMHPGTLGDELGYYLVEKNEHLFSGFNLVKGFLNLTVSVDYWTGFLHREFNNTSFGNSPSTGKKVIVEYASPNTNKPLHLGHLRNIFLGWSIAEILKATGNEVIKTCVVNDRGIHICKSMIAWKFFGNNETPESTGIKGDHFTGDYYVKFNDEYKKQVEELVSAGKSKDEAEQEAPIMQAAREMLVKWEQGDSETLELWNKMNNWVYEGFDVTYKRIGIGFDKVYYESNTYLSGKVMAEQGLQQGVLFSKDDGSIWIDLTEDGLDQKLILRKDGTSVYITQDLGLARVKYEDYHADESIYVIGDEQNYHMKVLKLSLQKLGAPYAAGIHHLSYGMVELPTGKMKSREGTVVDADDMIDEMINISRQKTEELGKVNDFTGDELDKLYTTIGLGALKFFLLRVDSKKRIIFNPEESIDFHGFTAPFIQYTYARIKSVLRKEQPAGITLTAGLLPLEKQVITQLEQFPTIILEAANEMDTSTLAVYIFNLAKAFNSFYTEHSIASAETAEKKELRLQLSVLTALVISKGMGLLGINVPERM